MWDAVGTYDPRPITGLEFANCVCGRKPNATISCSKSFGRGPEYFTKVQHCAYVTMSSRYNERQAGKAAQELWNSKMLRQAELKVIEKARQWKRGPTNALNVCGVNAELENAVNNLDDVVAAIRRTKGK